MSTPAISGPIAPYSNVNINAQFYQPSLFIISAVTLGVTTTVTTTQNNNYVIGQEVSWEYRKEGQLTGITGI